MGQQTRRVIGGAILIVGGVVVGVTTGQWNLAFAITGSGIAILTHKSPEAPEEGTIQENRVGGQQPLPVIYGLARLAGVFCDVRIHDASSQQRRLVLVVAYCHGSRDGGDITSIDCVWFDDRVAVSGTTTLAPYSFGPDGIVGSPMYLEHAHHLGSASQSADARLVGLFPSQWTSAARGRGVCYSRFELWYAPNIYPGGIPNIQVNIRGNRVYDPRDTTWKFSANPALCIMDYLQSSVYGMGIADANIDAQSFIDMANYCDELVDDAHGGTQARYACNGWLDTSRSQEQNLAELCSSCRGQVVNEGAKWRLYIRRARTVSGFKVNEGNTVEGTWQFIVPGTESAVNVVRADYNLRPSVAGDSAEHPSLGKSNVQWPAAGATNSYLTEDNGYEKRLDLDLPFTDNYACAQQMAMTVLKESRNLLGAMVVLKEEALSMRVGDLVEVTYSTPGWADKKFDVAAMLLQPDGNVQAVLVEYEPTAYDLDAQAEPPAEPNTNLPNPFSVPTPQSIVLTSLGQELQTLDGRYLSRIRVTFTRANNPFVDYYEVQAKRTADTSWDTFGRVGSLDDAVFMVYPVTDESWDVRIRSVNTIGVFSDWLASLAHVVETPDPRPQVTSITLVNTHADVAHIDSHSDTAHGDAGHSDAHTDDAHSDHDDHADSHTDDGAHDDVAHDDSHGDVGDIDTDHTDTHTDGAHTDHSDGHGDSHTDSEHTDTAHDDSHGDVGVMDTDHTDTHADNAHGDHDDSAFSHFDVAHDDSHSDSAHSDTLHVDGHTDGHGDGQYGVGIAIQADTDSASIRAIARKHGDHSDSGHTDVTEPTAAEVRTQPPFNGRNVVIDLIDVATGAQIVLNPGDAVRVGAIAYSDVDAVGVEGPVGYASVGLFNVAPVGADKWVPS